MYGIQSGLDFSYKKLSINPQDFDSCTQQHRSYLEQTAKFFNIAGRQNFTALPSESKVDTRSKVEDILLTHGIGFLNMWDFSINNKTIRPLLEIFGGCFIRSYLWLFVDLDLDIEALHLPPGGTEIDTNALGFRTKMNYLLRQCQLCKYSMYQNDTHKVCTIFATHSSTNDPKLLQEKKRGLQIEFEEAARQMDLDDLIDFNIVLVEQNSETARPLKMKLIEALEQIRSVKIPLSWLYLRGCLAHSADYCMKYSDMIKLADTCGLSGCSQEYNLEHFCNFFASFGSILDMRKFNGNTGSIPQSDGYIITKPHKFLLHCDQTLRNMNHENGIVNTSLQTEDVQLCISLMLSVGFGMELTQQPNRCYFPTIRKGERKRTIDKVAVQFVMSMSSPTMQKPASITAALQKYLPNVKIRPDLKEKWSNAIVISTRQDGPDQTPLNIFLSFQGDVIEVALYEKGMTLVADATLQDAVRLIVRAFHAVSKEKSIYPCKIKYHFAVRCQQNDNDSIDYYPYHKRHVLPRTKFCKQCLQSGITSDPFIQSWIAALRDDEVPDSVRLNGDLSPQDVFRVVEEVRNYPIEAIQLLSEKLNVGEFFCKHKDEETNRMWLVLGMLQTWQREVDKEDESPRKVLARILLAADKTWKERNEPNFGKLAQRIDMQVLTEHQKQILEKRKLCIS